VGVRDPIATAEFRQPERVFRARYDLRRVSQQLPAPCDATNELGPILEARATDDPRRLPARGQALERKQNIIAAHAALESVAETNMRRRYCDRVLIAEEVRDQRYVAAAARRCGEGAARDGDDQHGGRPRHSIRARARTRLESRSSPASRRQSSAGTGQIRSCTLYCRSRADQYRACRLA